MRRVSDYLNTGSSSVYDDENLIVTIFWECVNCNLIWSYKMKIYNKSTMKTSYHFNTYHDKCWSTTPSTRKRKKPSAE